MLRLAGGWGYDNLGDEAILAGYLECLPEEVAFSVASVDPTRTAMAQQVKTRFSREGKSMPAPGTLLLGGGGYLNGGWIPQIYTKLGRLAHERRGKTVVGHGIEVRKLDGRLQSHLAGKLFSGADIAVRDADSSVELLKFKPTKVEVFPDAISLLVPHLAKYVDPLADLKGRILINLLDLSARPDAAESGLDTSTWLSFCDELVASLGNRAIGLVVGAYDSTFMRRWPELELLSPTTVRQLVSSIYSADGLFSVRMHPGLIASGLNKPFVSVPYCGKIYPTLSRIGIEDRIMSSYDLPLIHAMLSGGDVASEKWQLAHDENVQWLNKSLGIKAFETHGLR